MSVERRASDASLADILKSDSPETIAFLEQLPDLNVEDQVLCLCVWFRSDCQRWLSLSSEWQHPFDFVALERLTQSVRVLAHKREGGSASHQQGPFLLRMLPLVFMCCLCCFIAERRDSVEHCDARMAPFSPADVGALARMSQTVGVPSSESASSSRGLFCPLFYIFSIHSSHCLRLFVVLFCAIVCLVMVGWLCGSFSVLFWAVILDPNIESNRNAAHVVIAHCVWSRKRGSCKTVARRSQRWRLHQSSGPRMFPPFHFPWFFRRKSAIRFSACRTIECHCITHARAAMWRCASCCWRMRDWMPTRVLMFLTRTPWSMETESPALAVWSVFFLFFPLFFVLFDCVCVNFLLNLFVFPLFQSQLFCFWFFSLSLLCFWLVSFNCQLFSVSRIP